VQFKYVKNRQIKGINYSSKGMMQFLGAMAGDGCPNLRDLRLLSNYYSCW
jgi:hypothetical protein